MLSLARIVSAIVVLLVSSTLAESGQVGEWHAYAGDKASTKYTALDQIDAESIGDLRVVWRQSTIPDETRNGNAMRAPAASQNTPLMARGRLYISTGLGMVAALDATTGEVVWVDLPQVSEGEEPRRRSATRGSISSDVMPVASPILLLCAKQPQFMRSRSRAFSRTAAELRRYPCYPIRGHPGDSDTCAFARHMSCTRRTDPGPTPCDQGHLSF